MSKPYFTIFTPTYNRAYKIGDLYESLKKQTFSDFEWLVVDDGSTDNTEQKVKEFIDEGVIDIRYIKKCNEGKHVAINDGAEVANGIWFFIVDSDDWLLDNALETTIKYCEQVNGNKEFAGVVGLRGNIEGNVWSTGNINKENSTIDPTKIGDEYVDATPVEYRYKLKVAGDRAEVIKTSVLKKYKFPSFEGEKFMPERYLWNLLSADGYKFRWFNKVVYVTEYLDDGLTKNGKELAKRNCRSRACADNISSGVKQIPFMGRLKLSINYYRYGKFSGDSYAKLFNKAKARKLGLIAIPLACIMPVK